MKRTVSPSYLEGQVEAPGSKSIMQRVLAAALLCSETTVIHRPADNADSFHALECILQLGADVEEDENGSLHITGGKLPPQEPLNVGESGLAMRLFAAIAAMSGYPVELKGQGSLLTRPLTAFEEVFPQLGAEIKTTGGKLPAVIQGPFTGGEFTLDGSMSSQFLSGLLMALPLAQQDSTIHVTDLKSKPYVDLTLEVLDRFGIVVVHKDYESFRIPGRQTYQPAEITIDGDWSAAASLLVAGAIASRNGIQIKGLGGDFTQADKAITGPLLFCGARLMNQDGDVSIFAPKRIGFNFDATDCPDLFPALAALAVFCKKPSTIIGVSRLTHKESNRGLVLQKEFAKAGVQIDIDGDVMTIHPQKKLKACTISSHNDHRIAMAAALLGLAGAPVTIDGTEAVDKSYPDFFEDLIELGADVTKAKK